MSDDEDRLLRIRLGSTAYVSLFGDPPISPDERAFFDAFLDHLLELEEDNAIGFFRNEETAGLLFQ